MKKEMMIEGMSCNHCKMRVEKALGEIEGVDNVTVDLEAKKATMEIVSEVGDDVLKEAVEDAGYDVTAIK
jgi:Cu+-exporting ATPase